MDKRTWYKKSKRARSLIKAEVSAIDAAAILSDGMELEETLLLHSFLKAKERKRRRMKDILNDAVNM